MASRNLTQAQFQDRIAALVGRGIDSRIAERMARKEVRLRSPQHKAALQRRLASADDRVNATGDLSAYRAVTS